MLEAVAQSTVVLPDGVRVPTRAITADDDQALQRLYTRLSPHTIYLRFFRMVSTPTLDQLHFLVDMDGHERVALVALDPDEPTEIIGVVRYGRDENDASAAEYAGLVRDDWQGRSLGFLMTRELVAIARREGIATLFALMLPENIAMLHLLQKLGVPMHTSWREGTVRADLDLREPLAMDSSQDSAT